MKLLIFFFLTICYNINSQIGWTFDELVAEWGNDYELLTAKKCVFDSCILYDYGNTRCTVAFQKIDDVNQCVYVHWSESIEEANKWINLMKERGYVESGDLTWRDYATGVEHKVDLRPDYKKVSYYKYFWE